MYYLFNIVYIYMTSRSYTPITITQTVDSIVPPPVKRRKKEKKTTKKKTSDHTR